MDTENSQVRQHKVILEMKISVEHKWKANIGNTNSLLSMLRY